MRRPSRLSATFVRTVRQPGRYGDGYGGFGLSLLVKQLGTGRLSKTWSQRIRIQGRVTNIGLGRYPIVTLKRARDKALENLQAVEEGRDPRGAGIPTFAAAAEKVIANHRGSWRADGRTEQLWRSSLEQHVYGRIGKKRVDRITRDDIVGVLNEDTGLWTRKPATAKVVRRRIGAVMKWAVGKGYRADNPVDAIAKLLPRSNGHVKHRRALPHGEVAEALVKVRGSRAAPAAKLALEFAALTACRSNEVRRARWDEVDLEAAVWTIPAERMKAGREHRVPLSCRALEVLAAARALHPPGRLPLVFPAARGGPLLGQALSRLTRGLGFQPHGLRTSFRNWCAETGVRRELAERCLAHVVKNRAERAYMGTDLLEQRREVMDGWAVYIGGAHA